MVSSLRVPLAEKYKNKKLVQRKGQIGLEGIILG